jgi:hypothetical protein
MSNALPHNCYMKTINLMPVQRPRFNFHKVPLPNLLPLNDALQIKAAEYWMTLGEADEALRELEKLRETRNRPAAVKVRVAAVGMLVRGEVAL